MAKLGHVLAAITLTLKTPYDGSKASFEFNKFKQDSLRRARDGKTHAQLMVETDDMTPEAVKVLGAELVNMLKNEQLTIVKFEDRFDCIDIIASWSLAEEIKNA